MAKNKKSPTPPQVYGFLDYQAFLKDWFDYKKVANPRYSHRLFARQAAIRSPSFLHLVMNGERNLSEEKAFDVAAAMKLDAQAQQFFIWLVRFQNAKTIKARQEAWNSISATRRFQQARMLDNEAIKVLSDWHYAAILEMASCDGFKLDPHWLSEHLQPSVGVRDTKRAIKTLVDLNLIELQDDGGCRVTNRTIVTPHEAADLAVHCYHTRMNQLAGEAIERFSPGDRHFGGVTVAVAEDRLPEIKQEIARFQERILDLCDGSDVPPNKVVQLNLQLFPLSKITNGGT